ncbi:hypothetical protein SH1V18_07440 [Vallitalea longa]|uniref:DUF4179 domain-containing protein n=1 Tax=Vallitalea longa TaxID=2936439 RepID=A0A9W6DF34_9FIRM|nr:DUF4179 domain-containing protein [Vallitalea longa]GKX28264.1 hypothetical protein SH1V18_07440 [Vallitalea longa]
MKYKKLIPVIMIVIIILIAIVVFVTNKEKSLTEKYDITDKGVQEAIENNYIQNVNISDEHDGIILTVDNIIVDNRRIFILYNIENTKHRDSFQYLSRGTFNVNDENDTEIPAIASLPDYDFDLNSKKKMYSSYDMVMSSEIDIPSNLRLDVTLYTSEANNNNKQMELPYIWSVEIPVDKEIFNNRKKTYDANEIIDIKGQKIVIDKLTVYPITSVLDINYDKNNTMSILGLQDIKIVSNGREYTNGIDGLTSSIKDEYNSRLYFESNYFNDNEKLNIEGSGFKGIDKNKENIIVDVDNKTILKAPDDNLKIDDVKNEDQLEIIFKYNGNNFSLDQTFTDSEGTIFETQGMSVIHREPETTLIYEIPKESEFVDPITIKISNYPNIINASYKVELFDVNR